MAPRANMGTGEATEPRTDSPFARMLRNAATLIGGNAVQGVGSLIVIALTARALGPTDFGTLVLASTLASIVSQLVGFQAWQAVIRFGAGRTLGDTDFGGLVKLGFAFDLAGASAAAIVGIGAVALGGWLFDWSATHQQLGYLFAAAVLFNIVGTPTAVLRVANEYRAFAIQSIGGSAVKVLSVAAAMYFHADVLTFAACWALSQVVANALLVVFALRTLDRLNLLPLRSHSARQAWSRSQGLTEFFFSTNLNTWARVVREFDVPLLGLILGPAAVGTFKIARQLAAALYRIIDPFFHASYPEFAKMCANGQIAAALQLAKRSSIMLGLVCAPAVLLFILMGEWLIRVALGDDYIAAYVPAVWCVTAAAIWAFAQPMSPLLMAAGRHRVLLVANFACTAAYLMALWPVSRLFGVAAAAAAFCAYNLLWTIVMSFLLPTATDSVAAGAHQPVATSADRY